MKITYSENYNLNLWRHNQDALMLRYGNDVTYAPFSSFWIEKDVSLDELQDLVTKGYAIKINC